MPAKKTRLDVELVNRELASSREKAQALIMAGEVLVGENIELKASFIVLEDQVITIKQRYPYVSRGAFKIESAVKEFKINPEGYSILDIGISNGGFSDYLLKKGAKSVLGVDVNINQVDVSLRDDERVTLLKKNARYLTREDIKIDPDLIVIDLSFISVQKILPCLKDFKKSQILSLIKPQFEAKKGEVKKGGVIRDKKKIDMILERVRIGIEEMGLKVVKTTTAGIKGRKGNQEYFFLIKNS